MTRSQLLPWATSNTCPQVNLSVWPAALSILRVASELNSTSTTRGSLNSAKTCPVPWRLFRCGGYHLQSCGEVCGGSTGPARSPSAVVPKSVMPAGTGLSPCDLLVPTAIDEKAKRCRRGVLRTAAHMSLCLHTAKEAVAQASVDNIRLRLL